MCYYNEIYSVISDDLNFKVIKLTKNKQNSYDSEVLGITPDTEKNAWNIAVLLTKTNGKIPIFEVKFFNGSKIEYKYVCANSMEEALRKTKEKIINIRDCT